MIKEKKQIRKTESSHGTAFLSVPVAAQLCGVCRNTMYKWVKESKVSAYQTPGRRNMIRPSDLIAFMRSTGLFIPNQLENLAVQELHVEQVASTGQAPLDISKSDKGFSIPEAAVYCGVQRYTMWRWVREGRVEAHRTEGGTHYRIAPSALVNFMQKNGMYLSNQLLAMANRASSPVEPRGVTVLVADGDDYSRAFAEVAFQSSFKVHAAKTSIEAIELLSEHEDVQVVHLNLTTLGKDGFRILSVMLRMRPDVAIIAVVEDTGRLTEHILSDQRVVPLGNKSITSIDLQAALEKARQVCSAQQSA